MTELDLDRFQLSKFWATEDVEELLNQIVNVNYHSIIVTGKTGVGKTTVALTLLKLAQEGKLKLAINDVVDNTTLSNVLEGKNIVEMIADESSVSVKGLLMTSLSLANSYTYTPEIRDDNAEALLEMVNSGNSVVTTMFSSEPKNVIGRLHNAIQRSGGNFTLPTKTIEIYLETITFQGNPLRYISEVIEYTPEGGNLVFKQTPNDHLEEGHLYFNTEEGQLSVGYNKALTRFLSNNN